MVQIARIKGMDRVVKNLKRLGPSAGRGIAVGLKSAGLFLQRESQLIVPIDTGNLRSSAFTRAQGAGLQTEVKVGYTADYAVKVHEDLRARHAPGKSAKFLERPLREKRKQILDVIDRTARKAINRGIK